MQVFLKAVIPSYDMSFQMKAFLRKQHGMAQNLNPIFHGVRNLGTFDHPSFFAGFNLFFRGFVGTCLYLPKKNGAPVQRDLRL